VISPGWSPQTKEVVALTLIALTAVFLWKFSTLVTPLMMTLIVVYLLHPITDKVRAWFRLSWGVSVTLVYLLLIVLFLGLVTVGGVGLVQQVQSLISSVQGFVTDLPALIDTVTHTVYKPFGLFTIDLSHLDLNAVGQELTSYIEPVLSQTGTLVGSLAAGAAESLGWGAFILTVSFFVMLESSGDRRDIIKVKIPGYEQDVERIMHELSLIWNAFLRGQFIIFFLALVVYSILLPIFGVRYALGIALMAAIAKFLPYVGPAITWSVLALVAFLYPPEAMAGQALLYTGLVFGIILFIDQIIDSIIAPRIMADALKVHPAAVLVAIIIGASLFGLLGVVIAAPLLATFTLIIRYLLRKMFDMDPWPEQVQQDEPAKESKIVTRVKGFLLARGWMSKK
jgi:predicted PurR-regulated permease PerM